MTTESANFHKIDHTFSSSKVTQASMKNLLHCWCSARLLAGVVLNSVSDSLGKPKMKRRDDRVIPIRDADFRALPTNFVDHTALPASWEMLNGKNRYSDIIPNPHSRVQLQPIDDDPISQYINANFIAGLGTSPQQYIASQGPTHESLVDFWRMAWEQGSNIIVMLTGLIEQGRQKCSSYWPEQVGHTVQHGAFHITLVSSGREDLAGAYIRSELLVRSGDAVRTIWHFWYDTWPDHGAPQDVAGAVNMLHDVRAHSEEVPSKPWIVHCSAGIGRTGSFIAIDMGARELAQSRHVEITPLISTMRRDRGGMVQTYVQADFVYRALVAVANRLGNMEEASAQHIKHEM